MSAFNFADPLPCLSKAILEAYKTDNRGYQGIARIRLAPPVWDAVKEDVQKAYGRDLKYEPFFMGVMLVEDKEMTRDTYLAVEMKQKAKEAVSVEYEYQPPKAMAERFCSYGPCLQERGLEKRTDGYAFCAEHREIGFRTKSKTCSKTVVDPSNGLTFDTTASDVLYGYQNGRPTAEEVRANTEVTSGFVATPGLYGMVVGGPKSVAEKLRVAEAEVERLKSDNAQLKHERETAKFFRKVSEETCEYLSNKYCALSEHSEEGHGVRAEFRGGKWVVVWSSSPAPVIKARPTDLCRLCSKTPADPRFYSPVSGGRCEGCAKAMLNPSKNKSRWSWPVFAAASMVGVAAWLIF